MTFDYSAMSDKQLLTTYRIAKTRLYAFFKDPKEMIKLRNAVELRKRKEPK